MGEYMDIVLNERVDKSAMLEKLRETVPEGFEVYSVSEVPMGAPSLMSAVTGADYGLMVKGDAANWQVKVDALLAMEAVDVERTNKKRKRRRSGATRTIDIRPMIRSLDVMQLEPGAVIVRMALDVVDGQGAKAREVRTQLEAPEDALLVRFDTRFVAELCLEESEALQVKTAKLEPAAHI
jgi:radical SAM-linked protein